MHSIDNGLIKDRVVAELRKAILFRDFQAGQELYQDKIASELGVSRMPVREALQILHNEGLVTVKPNKVAYVNQVSEKYLRDHFSVRCLLEQEAVRLACQNKPDHKLLSECYEKAEEAIRQRNIKLYDDYNMNIHQTIWKASDNVVLERLLSQLWNSIMIDDTNSFSFASVSNKEHKVIIDAIDQGNINLAVSSIGKHVNGSYEQIMKRLNKN